MDIEKATPVEAQPDRNPAEANGDYLPQFRTNGSVEKEPYSTVVEQNEQEMASEGVFGRHSRLVHASFHVFCVAVLLGWWIPTLIINRHYWIPVTCIAWFFIGLIAFQYIPNRVFIVPISRFHQNFIAGPWYKLPHWTRLTIGWLALLALIFGSSFGVQLQPGVTYGSRAQSVFGIFVFQVCLYLCSANRRAIRWHTVIVGLIYQQALALFVLKSEAGYAIFRWFAVLVSDFLRQGEIAAEFFFGTDLVITQALYFCTVLPIVICFVAFAETCVYYGIFTWIVKKLGWFFFTTMDISGAEATVAAASPFVGQGESAVLIRAFADECTKAELHQIMVSGFATMSGSVLAAYVLLFGIPPAYIITASIMSIPAAISISKLRMPETEEPLTAGRMIIPQTERKYQNGLQAFSGGSLFGVKVATLVFCNVLAILFALYTFNGILTYVGRSWHINALTLELIFSYIFYPLAWLMGVPNEDILKVSSMLGTKLIANEFVAYTTLNSIRDTMTDRGVVIASFAIASFSNIGSCGIQIGVLSALAPSKKVYIVKIAISALACGFISCCQAATIAGMLY